ncbi:MAG: CvpA family protein [Syntrophobacteraceae bacterium]|nr:CvpA family protein [Syntrophobacteraceae bacterium]
MSTLDWIIVVVGGLCIVRGIMRGAVSQVFGILGLYAGFLLASSFHGSVAARLAQAFPDIPGAQAVSFGLLFFLTWLCIAIFGFWVSRLVRLTGLALVDRTCGGVLGACKAALLTVVVVLFLTAVLSPRHEILKESRVAPLALEAGEWLMRVAPGDLPSLLEKKGEELKRFRRDGGTQGEEPKKPPRKEGRSV